MSLPALVTLVLAAEGYHLPLRGGVAVSRPNLRGVFGQHTAEEAANDLPSDGSVTASPQAHRSSEAIFPPTLGTSISRARLLLLATAALWGTYPVLLRAVYSTGIPCPPSVVSAVRCTARTLYTSLVIGHIHRRLDSQPRRLLALAQVRYVLMATLSSGLVLARRMRRPQTSGEGERSMSRAAFCLATAELSLIGASGNLLSAWAIARLSAARSEVLMATVHVFVPLLQAQSTLVLCFATPLPLPRTPPPPPLSGAHAALLSSRRPHLALLRPLLCRGALGRSQARALRCVETPPPSIHSTSGHCT